MKKKYSTNSKFFVVFALNKRVQIYENFKLDSIRNDILSLFDVINNAPNNELTDGEITEALSHSLIETYSDSTYSHYLPAIINWYLISE